VDIGGGACEAAVISLGGVVTHNSVRVGGEKLDEAVGNYIRKYHNLNVGEQTTEAVKIKLGSAIRLKRPETMEVSGRDTVTGLPRTEIVTSEEVYEAILEPVMQMVESIRTTLSVTPPELISDIVDRGIVLSGGTAQLRNLDLLVTREIGVSAHVAIEPRFCVIKGTGAAIENLEMYWRTIK
jgi:rod shape-determining protein MreB